MLANYLCLFLAVASVVSGVTEITYPPKISSQCDQSDLLQDEQIMNAFSQQLGPQGCNPPENKTCQDILHCFPSSSSDYYQIKLVNGSTVQVYCDMEGTNCGEEGGWMRVAYVNMMQPGATCPQGLFTINISGLILCARTASRGCLSTHFPVHGLPYSQVCGHLRGYQLALPDAFLSSSRTINQAYVDGVSITHGISPRQHIWTYAAGQSEAGDNKSKYCPCNSMNTKTTPSYVGSDYYCESAQSGSTNDTNTKLISNDPLWDGQQCGGDEAPCCAHSNMPWFIKALTSITTDDIELRLCGSNISTEEDAPIEIIELFVQ